jgi:hypothetical protein
MAGYKMSFLQLTLVEFPLRGNPRLRYDFNVHMETPAYALAGPEGG